MKFADSTAERCQVVGTTGVISLLGNINKHRTFVDSGVGEEVYIRVETSAGLWEVSVGTFDAEANTITRQEFVSSITGSAINFPAGTHTCYSVLPASKYTVDEVAASVDLLVQTVVMDDESALSINAGANESNIGKSVDIKPGQGSGSNSGGITRLWAAGPSGQPAQAKFVAGYDRNETIVPLSVPVFSSGASSLELTTLPDGCIAFDPAFGLVVTYNGAWVPAVFP